MKNKILTLVTAAGLGLGLGWGIPPQEAKAQEAKKKELKSQEEYALYDAYVKATDAKGKIAALDKWKQGFPNSDFADDWEQEYLILYQQANMNRQAFDKAVEILKTHPNHFYALSAIVRIVYTLNPPQPADLDTAERVSKYLLDNVDTVFAASNKPADVKDPDWNTYKPAMRNAAQATYAWVFVQRKDHARAEVELTKFLQLDPTQAQSSLTLGGEILAQRDPAKQVAGLYQIARAAAYDGPNSLPAAQRQTARDLVTKYYTTYHGSTQGLDQLLAAAKASAFPPADFKILSSVEIAALKAKEEEEERAKNPMLTLWLDIKKELMGDTGAAYFEEKVKGFGLPGGVNGVAKFKGKLVRMTPANRPKQLFLAIEKPDVEDVTLTFEEPLPGTMDPGADLEFEGVPQSFTKEPFRIEFETQPEQLVGWTPKKAAPAKPAPGKAKAKAKAKTK